MKKYSLVALVVLAVGSFAIFNWLNQPNNGNVQHGNTSNDVLSASKSTVPMQASLFSTVYDSTLRIKTSTENENGAIYSQHLLTSKNDGDDSQIGITVAPKENSVNDVSPAKFRLLDSGYQQITSAFAPEGSLVFVKNTGSSYEITVVWQGNRYYSAVAGSGTSANRQHIDELVSDVVSNWQWEN